VAKNGGEGVNKRQTAYRVNIIEIFAPMAERSFLRHAGLAQTGEICAFGQGADRAREPGRELEAG
jgi:hypothetical protein